MAGNLSVNDVNYIYERLTALAKDMQRTRSPFIMARDVFLDTLAAAHMPVAAPEQHLTAQQVERKRFYDAVIAVRNEWNGYGQSKTANFGAALLTPTDARIIKLVNLVNYAKAHAPVGDPRDTQIIAKLASRNWSHREMDDCGTWS